MSLTRMLTRYSSGVNASIGSKSVRSMKRSACDSSGADTTLVRDSLLRRGLISLRPTLTITAIALMAIGGSSAALAQEAFVRVHVPKNQNYWFTANGNSGNPDPVVRQVVLGGRNWLIWQWNIQGPASATGIYDTGSHWMWVVNIRQLNLNKSAQFVVRNNYTGALHYSRAAVISNRGRFDLGSIYLN